MTLSSITYHEASPKWVTATVEAAQSPLCRSSAGPVVERASDHPQEAARSDLGARRVAGVANAPLQGVRELGIPEGADLELDAFPGRHIRIFHGL